MSSVLRDERPTPYELFLEPASFEGVSMPLLREQAEARGATTMGELLALPAGGALLRELVPDADATQHRDLVEQMGALLFHAFRYWLHERIVYRFSENATRALFDQSPEEWAFIAPAPAGYVQLPRNMIWARPASDAQAEAADGFFWSAPSEFEGGSGQRLDVLLALGVRADRPGLTVVPVSIEPGIDPVQWADVRARPDGEDFANILPGGELKQYHALTTHAELLKLVVRAFRHIDRARDSIRADAGVHLVD
jgi:hypothetical protein